MLVTIATSLLFFAPATSPSLPLLEDSAATSGCSAEWQPTFGGLPGVDGIIYAQGIYQDLDTGEQVLYVGGMFDVAGGVPAPLLARWDGASWSSIPGAPSGPGPIVPNVRALQVLDDGSGAGPGLYVGGFFPMAGGQQVNSIARLDANGWSSLGTGILGSSASAPVLAMTVFDDGNGPALYVAGTFGTVGGVPMNHIARWDGSSWSSLGSGIDAGFYVNDLAVYDDGNGPALYAGGQFTQAGGVAVSHIARWDGTAWSDVGGGVNGIIQTLAVFDDGGGAKLFAGGGFGQAGGQPAARVASWNGSSWAAVGGGAAGSASLVYRLETLDLGAGAALYGGGSFDVAGGGAASVVRWDGASWSGVGSSTPFSSTVVTSFEAFDAGDGSGTKLVAAGSFSVVGALGMHSIAAWDGAAWSPLGSGLASSVAGLASFDPGDGGGPSLYATGGFISGGNTAAQRIARWDGGAWSPLGSGLDAYGSALASHDLGSGPALYVAGNFNTAGGLPASKIASWDGTAWSPLGTGMDQGVEILALLGADLADGNGPGLYAGGGFQIMGGVAARHVARWDGASWSALGTGPNSRVFALAAFDPGSGPALFAGGLFTSADGVAANRIAMWDGSAWSALGLGIEGGGNPSVHSLAVFDDGNGAALYVGGWFGSAGGIPASNIARWDGTTWSAVGAGLEPTVKALAVFDDGNGPALYAGGGFLNSGGQPVNRIARWDGASWAPLGGGVLFGQVHALHAFDDGEGPALYAGGTFRSAPDSGDSYLAKWGCADSGGLGTPFCFGDGSGTACPCANAGASGQGCANGTGQGATLDASGSSSVSASNLVLSGSNLIPGQFGLYLQANNRVNGGDGNVFGDGLRCAGGGLIRLQVRIASPAGSSSTSIDVASQGGVTGGETRAYQLWYRDAFSSPCGAGFNLSNGLELTWVP